MVGEIASGNGEGTTTPASTSTSSGTESTPAPASAGASSEGSALASLEKVSASLSETTGTPASAQGEQATGQPAGAALPSGTTAKPGSTGYSVPPKEQWETVLGNARVKATEDAFKALGGTREQVASVVGWYSRMQQDPIGFARQLLAEAEEARGGAGGSVDDEPLVDPEPDLRSADGKGAYSADAMKQIIQNMETRLSRQFKTELAPHSAMLEQGKQAAEHARITAEGQKTAQEIWTEAVKLPHFETVRADVAKILAEMDPVARRKVGSAAALYMAYNKAFAEKVLPTLGKAAETKVTQDFARKAAAAVGTVVPGGGEATAKKPVRDGDVSGLAARMRELEAAGTTA